MSEELFIAKCKLMIKKYTENHLDKSDTIPDFDIYTVWLTKALQNNKGLFSTTLNDGMYYEITYNGDKQEFYFDAYKKFENMCIRDI